MKQQIEESLGFIRSTTDIIPKGLVILGTGLGQAIGELAQAVTISYSHIPNFPTPTAPTHSGELIIGRFGSYPLAVMQGRPHYYEGYSMAEVTYPLEVLRALGVDTLVITNAAGALNVDYQVGDIVLISDHINLMGENPLRGRTGTDDGIRFPVMSQAYDPDLTERFRAACLSRKLSPRSGVYAAVCGPSLETPAELRFLHSIGADLVGMSTVPEVTVGVWLNMRILGISVVSNKAVFEPRILKRDLVEEINHAAQKAGRDLARVFSRFFKGLEYEGK
ncbi:purine-nucleoside phosphorylase [candidate division WOR-3 bacterium]|nr:purine-nucleoside phosphorylase [candidate division WOR-3 bacterium]